MVSSELGWGKKCKRPVSKVILYFFEVTGTKVEVQVRYYIHVRMRLGWVDGSTKTQHLDTVDCFLINVFSIIHDRSEGLLLLL